MIDGALLADLIVVLHLVFVLFVLLGELGVLVGAAAGWTWIRRFRLRFAHLVCAWIPAVEALVGVVCPLTDWERELRKSAGQSTEEIGFVARLVRDVLFYDAPPWVFGASYVAFALLVTASFVWIPPRKRERPAR